MSKILKFRHSGDMGDIIAGLYTVKHICEKENAVAELYLDTNGGKDNPIIMRQSGGLGNKFNNANYEFLKPLLEIQRYIRKVDKYNKSVFVDYDLDDFRKVFFDRKALEATHMNLLYAHQYAFDIPLGYEKPWLDWIDVPTTRKTLISRSTRYHSSDQMYLIRRNETGMSFMGTDIEAKSFLDCTRIETSRVSITNALDAAKQICASEEFLVNGTLFYWIAVGLGHKKIWHEVGVDIPTTVFKEDIPSIKYVIGNNILK